MHQEAVKLHNFKSNFLAFLFALLTVNLIVWGVVAVETYTEGRVLGFIEEFDSVTVTATVETCYIKIKAYPEKRIPKTGNWNTDYIVDFYNSGGTFLTTVEYTSGDNGISPQLDMCTYFGEAPTPGNFGLRVKGLSHLRRRYTAIPMFNSVETLVDLTALGPDLYAGETSIIFDNYINGLDLSTQVVALYTGDRKNDLNQDGIVNALDLSNTIFNLYMNGDD